MPQDRESGAAAAAWGRHTAVRIGQALGATSTSSISNEFSFRGRRVVIKTAHLNTTSVGVTYHMLERLDDVLAAFEVNSREFDVWSIPARTFEQHVRDSRSRGSAGKVGLVTRRVFQELGQRVGSVRI
jgi:hypothetical protein